MKKRAYAYLTISLVFLISFLIAVFAIGFRDTKDYFSFNLNGIRDYVHHNTIYDDNSSYLMTGYSFMVLSFSLVTLAIIGASIMVAFSYRSTRVRNKWDAYFWLQFGIITSEALAWIFMITGELVFMQRFYNYIGASGQKIINDDMNFPWLNNLAGVSYDAFWNTGFMAGMLIFTIIPAPFIAYPRFVKYHNLEDDEGMMLVDENNNTPKVPTHHRFHFRKHEETKEERFDNEPYKMSSKPEEVDVEVEEVQGVVLETDEEE